MQVRIQDVETFLVDIPTIRPHRLSMATMNTQTILIVRIHTSDGLVGFGEASTIGGLSYAAESPEGMKLAIDTYVTPVLRECDPDNIRASMSAIESNVRENHFAKCAIETALFDRLGKRFDCPIYQLLGGRLRESLPIAWSLASGDTANDITEAEQMLEQRRHRIFKLKIGRCELKSDLKHVAAIKRSVGDRASIRVDVNQAWSEATAARGIAELEDIGVELVEQPIANWNREGMARLAARALIPIMADEALYGPKSAHDLAKREAADVFAVKIAQSGGLNGAVQVAAVADAAGIGLYGGTMLEAAIGTVASAHVFVTLPNLEWGTELFGPLLLKEDILTEPLKYSNFSLTVPNGPGLGISLDEERISYFRRDGFRRTVVPIHHNIAAR